MYSGNMWSMHHGYNYGKRSAEAEPTADADAYYGPYSGYNWNMNNNWMNNNWNMNRNWNMNNMNYMNNWTMMNMMNSGYNWPMDSGYMWYRPGMQGYSYHSYNYGKRSAEADAWYGPYGYPRFMSYMNRPYHYYGYRYYF